MPTLSRPSLGADEACETLHGLAHATRLIHDPSEILAMLGSLARGLAYLKQALHQLGQFHDAPAHKRAWSTGYAGTDRAASYQVAWKLHRAAQVVHQVAAGVDRAHEIEATIAYGPCDAASLPNERRLAADNRLSL